VAPKSIKSIYIGGNLCSNDIYSNNIYMKKSELKALIKEVVEESLTNTNQPIDQRLSLIKGKTVSSAYIAGGGYIVITFKDGSRLEIDAKGENKFGVSLDKNL